MIITMDNLKAGIAWWKPNFETDILNSEYDAIYNARSVGVTEQWWTATVDRLGRWKAYRGRTPPNTKAAIAARGVECLAGINAEYQKLMAGSATEPNVVTLKWEDVAQLFALAFWIKRSPVFASKLCHFLFPRLFIVMDNQATSVFDYEFYWRGMKDEWGRFEAKAEALSIRTDSIASDKPVQIHRLYPFETKIMELSHVGWNWGAPVPNPDGSSA